MISSPQMLKNVSLIVMDELQMLGDASRGAKLEVVLTQILRLDPRSQLIGLSAVLERADNLARWMKAELLCDDKRPTELLQGIFYNNLFRYRTYNTLETGEEKLAEVKLKDFKSVLLANAGYLIDNGDQILVFVKSKTETIELAKNLAQRLALPAAYKTLGELAGLADTLLKDYLRETLQGSVAFHNADLTQAESSLVLRNFNLGGIRLICTTTTLAMGVNTPANTVFLEADFWEYFQKHERAMLSPLRWPMYENISGRAGRLGYNDTPGRSILVASSQFEFDKYWRNYIENKDAGFVPQLNSDRLSDYVLLAIALGDIKKVHSVKEFFSSTYTGYLKREGFSTPALEEANLDESLSYLENNGFLKIDTSGEIILLSLGKVTTLKGISVLTALGILNFLRMKTLRDLNDLEVLYQALDLEDGRHFYIPMPGAEYWEKTYEVEIRDRLGGSRNLIPELKEILNRGQMAIYREARNMKGALLLQDWIQGFEMKELEKKYRTYAGTIGNLANDVSWIIDAMGALSHSINNDKDVTEWLNDMVIKLELGVKDDYLAMAKLGVKGLRRKEIFKLVRAGFYDTKKLRQALVDQVAWVIPYNVAEEVIELVNMNDPEIPAPGKTESHHKLATRLDFTGNIHKKKTEVAIDGQSLFLSNKSFEILLRLAVSLKSTPEGWVHKLDISKNDGASQTVRRLKKELRKYGMNEEILENDGAGSYRLILTPEEITIQKSLLEKHWSAVVRELVKG